MTYDELQTWWKHWRLTAHELAIMLGIGHRTLTGMRQNGVPEWVANYIKLFNATTPFAQNELLRQAWRRGPKGFDD